MYINQTLNIKSKPKTTNMELESPEALMMRVLIADRKVYVYYESRKRELKIRLVNEGRCDERLEATCLTHTGLHDKTN
jgi:hypothetical protein